MKHIPKKWANVRGIFLKTADSVALPLFQVLPERGAKIEAEGTAVAIAAPAALPASVVPAAGPSRAKDIAGQASLGAGKGKPALKKKLERREL